LTFDFKVPIYFYKADAPYGCFSNFSPHAIELDGKSWQTVEHYYQAHKYQGTDREDLMERIRTAKTPELAAEIGRNPQYQMRRDWDDRKCEIMYCAVWKKFSTHLDIQRILVDTGEVEIIEDSPVDYFWGCGGDRTGANHLGQILMKIRQEIQGKL
jgi:N-glycosidase YbiA